MRFPLDHRRTACPRVLIVLVCLTLLTAFFTPVSSRAALAERVVLKNGLVLLHAPRHGLPIVRVAVAIRAGGLDDPPDKAGLSNLTAALLTEGTRSRTAREISRDIEFVGGSLSAAADTDYTTVSLTVLKKDVELGFDLLADVLTRPSFPDDEVERVRQRILGAIRQKKEDPGAVADETFRKAVFGDHPYGKPVEGFAETVPGISRDDIAAFHRRYYLPNNAWMAVVGDLSRTEFDRLFTRYFSDWKSADIPTRAVPDPPKPHAETVVVDRDLTQANIRVGQVSIPRNHPDYYALSVANYILGGGGFSSRLMDSIRDNLGLAYSVYSYLDPGLGTGLFVAGGETKNESARRVLMEIDREITRLRTESVTDRELADAKSFLIGSFPLRLDSTAKILRFLIAVEYYGLGLDYPDRYPGIIGSITAEDVMNAARKHLHPDRMTRTVVARKQDAGL